MLSESPPRNETNFSGLSLSPLSTWVGVSLYNKETVKYPQQPGDVRSKGRHYTDSPTGGTEKQRFIVKVSVSKGRLTTSTRWLKVELCEFHHGFRLQHIHRHTHRHTHSYKKQYVIKIEYMLRKLILLITYYSWD